jgi:hypothetical protein
MPLVLLSAEAVVVLRAKQVATAGLRGLFVESAVTE